MNATDATRLSGDAYSTRIARRESPAPDNNATRLAQKGYESRLARDADHMQTLANEFYKIGEKINGRYEVSAIHHGAMGVVYGCFDHETKLPRALKTIRARYANDKQVLSLFESEAFVWVSLEKHPYIVRAYLVERFNNLPYVITEYVRGPEGMEGDLRGWLGHPRLTLPVAVTMALQIAQGMQHAVRKVPNLVHRDLKPANILVNSEGKAMVTDFGLVHAGQSDAGTPAYMSPEQWRAEMLDPRSDIYAYGCILFEMFTGHRLFPAMTEREWKQAHLASTPAELTGLVPQLPGEIDQFVRNCLKKSKAVRPRNWDEVVAFFAEWYHRLTGKSVVFDFSTLALDCSELLDAGYSLQNLSRNEDAIKAFDQALVIDPNYSLAWNNKGAALGNLKRHDEAIQAYDRALAIDPNDSFAWNNKGAALGNLKRHDEATKAYDRALTIDLNNSAAWYNKGNVLVSLNRYDEAIKAYDRALTIDPNYSFALCSKGIALKNLKRYEEAIKAFDRALIIDPNNFDVWYNRGNALGDLNRHEEAIKAYDRALMIDPNNSEAWNNKGIALDDLNRHEEAIQTWELALAIDPNNSMVWYNKGNALGDLNRHEEAIKAYDRALVIDPNKSSAWNNKGFALAKLERYEEAIQAWEQVLVIDPNDSLAWSNKGNALKKLNRNEEAIKAYDQALVIDPNKSSAWNNKGNALQNLKRYEEAIKAYDRTLVIDKTNKFALQGRQSAVNALKTAN